MKIKELLNSRKEIKKIEKETILSYLLNVKNKDLILISDDEVSKAVERLYNKYLDELRSKPVQYITHTAYFFGYNFYVNENVLIPRPETEVLVEDTIKLIKNTFNNKQIKILDIGTGSGCIAICLKKEFPDSYVVAIDISSKALEVAKKNSIFNKTDIVFYENDLLKGITEKFDVIISNPPYLIKEDKTIEEKVIKNEPNNALFGGNDGLYFYKRIIKESIKVLNKKNIIAFETGDNQSKRINKIAKEQYPNSNIINKKDYNNFERYTYIINNE